MQVCAHDCNIFKSFTSQNVRQLVPATQRVLFNVLFIIYKNVFRSCKAQAQIFERTIHFLLESYWSINYYVLNL